ncbi:MAG: dockerin type I domain-containing protein [Planctomycetota bacterium]
MLQRKRKRNKRRQRPMRVESLERRALMAGDVIGITPVDTGEVLLGNVVVTPVLFESDGGIDPSTEDWDIAGGEIDDLIDKITTGVNWWSETLDRLETVHEVSFTVDEAFAQDPFEIPYEPIDGSSEDFHLWVGGFLAANGYGGNGSLSIYENLERAMREFNHDQRIKHNADWSFTIFVVDSSDDSTGFFKAGRLRGAFAFAGGLFIVMPSTRPESTVAHELGHIFWARDEYSEAFDWEATRGYYDAQNYNSLSNTTEGFVQDLSIMAGGSALTGAYENFYSAESTLAHVGWRDSDGDGIFDIADVPLDLQGSGYFDASTSTYRFIGSASAVTLMNQNSSGPQSDITFNRISRLEYRAFVDDGSDLDDDDKGPWMTVSEPDQQVVMFDESFQVTQPFNTIEFRVIDGQVGVTSPIIQGGRALPAFSDSSVTGVAFIDENQDGQRTEEEDSLANTAAILRNGDGSALFQGEAFAADYSDGFLDAVNGASLRALGNLTFNDVGALDLNVDTRSFHWWDAGRRAFQSEWVNDGIQFEASLDQPVGEVVLHGIALDQPGFLRIEAYDSDGNFLSRVTSDAIELGESVPVTINDSMGRIAKVVAYGHAGIPIGLTGLQFGHNGSLQSNEGGAFQFQNLPDGVYELELVAENVIHQFDSNLVSVEVANGISSMVVASAQRVDSSRHNSVMPFDTNGDTNVTASDALVVINDLERLGARLISSMEPDGFDVDTTNDGFVSAVDALIVINQLARHAGEGEQIPGLSGEGDDSLGGLVAAFQTSGEWDCEMLDTVTEIEQIDGPLRQISSFSFSLGPSGLGENFSQVSHSSDSCESPESNRPDSSEPFLQLLV